MLQDEEEDILTTEDSAARQGRENEESDGSPIDGDLSDVYFESLDELRLVDEAQERMDDGFVEEEEEGGGDTQGFATTVQLQQESPRALHRAVEEKNAVLEGDPVQSIYSRAESQQTKPKITFNHVSPQRRPRPHVMGQRRSSVSRSSTRHLPMANQDHGYNLRFSPSARRYSPMMSNKSYRFHPTQQARSRYYQRYRARNGWNPQAAFPASLSNPRFLKYVPNSSPNKVPAKSRVDDVRGNSGGNNLNLNHLMKPPAVPPQASARILSSSFLVTPQPPSAVTFGTVDVHTPHYFFNLTSHLIRTEQLDSARRSARAIYKSREPRSAASSEGQHN